MILKYCVLRLQSCDTGVCLVSQFTFFILKASSKFLRNCKGGGCDTFRAFLTHEGKCNFNIFIKQLMYFQRRSRPGNMRSHLTCKSVQVPMSFICICALHLLVLHDIRCETQSMPCPCTLYCSLAKIKIVSHPQPAPHQTGSPSDSKWDGEPDSSLEPFTRQDQEDI